MPATRSSTRAASSTVHSETIIKTSKMAAPKRGKRKVSEVEDDASQVEETKVGPKRKAKKARMTKTTSQKVVKVTNGASTTTTTVTVATTSAVIINVAPETGVEGEADALVPAQLSFSFEEAKAHLINADARFEDLFERLPCKPYEELEMVHPFSALTISILGQQISWLAARSIKHKFIRMFNPDIPENHADYPESAYFPTPGQVASTDIPTLRTAGLSQRKAEYVQDLALRFADGRLSTKKLLAADDEELAQMLIEVRGIGRWTVDMFAMFSLRRPDILPVGDLGVQRGMVRWFLAQHSPTYNVTISPQKETRKPKPKPSSSTADVLDQTLGESASQTETPPADLSSLPPAPETPKRKNKTKKKNNDEEAGPIPPPFTPSIEKALRKPGGEGDLLPPLPEGLSVSVLKTRLDGKKKIKGAFLTPSEMEVLTESWRPYRSLGVYYMWALADAELGD
ncbi:hypothetical protein AAF712_000128 [Marasmius tenuissimus]|uniref:HhH-GPD domain-containing protein n=1 Tax=Marasmius tenuissimus TaxID=585030 RepID=A0ABR3AFQ0_9AGAR